MELHQEVIGTISSIAFGGEGILRHEGFVIFVPFTLPEEVVKIKITELKKNFARGAILEVIQPSQFRVKPPCPYFSLCGGCQFQHTEYPSQANFKTRFIEDALKKIGQVDLKLNAFEEAKGGFAYRRHIRLSLIPKGQNFQAGFIGNDYRFLKIETCLIFHDSHNIFLSIQNLVSQLDNSIQQNGSISILKVSPEAFVLFFEFDKEIPSNWKILPLNDQIIGILLKDKKKQISIGTIVNETHVDGLTIQFSPQCFIQNHAEQSLKIYHKIIELSHHLLEKKNPKILDLYCGIGISTLLVSKFLSPIEHSITGIESNPLSIELAKKNAHLNELSNVNFLCNDAAKVLGKLQFVPDLLIVNPPRIGLDIKITEKIIKNRPQQLIYISCMPSTFARDVQILCKNGYKIKYVMGFDQFPQTTHVEILANLELV